MISVIVNACLIAVVSSDACDVLPVLMTNGLGL